jgi:xylulokinase
VSLLAVDMGSSSCKAIAFAEDGRVLAHKSSSYPPPQCLHPSWADMPAENFWRALLSVTQAISAELHGDPVQAIAISSHAETFVVVDKAGQPLAPAILNFDTRAVVESAWLSERLGRRHIFDITGLAVHPMYPVPKILWLRKHAPAVVSRAASFLAVPDYLLTRLGFSPLIDYSLASRFLAFDVLRRAWSQEILSACELEPEQLSRSVQAGTVAGELSSRAADELGVRAGTLVVVGGHDQPCAAVGCGALEPGRVSASFGTYECLAAASDAPALTDVAFTANLNTYCHVIPGRYLTIAYFPSGIMLDWFVRLISPGTEAGKTSLSELCARLEAHSGQDPSGLCITPHLLGTCNPDFDPDASGVITGIRPSTRPADLYKGILEGIAFEFANMAELLGEAAGPYRDVYISGGGVHSSLGLKLRAALSGRELHLMRCSEAVCLGTAMLAGVAADKYSSLKQAAEQLVRVSQSIAPDAALAESYAAQRERYRILYSSLAPLRRAHHAGN